MSLPNIIQQINSKLPLSGGTLTGTLVSTTNCFSKGSSTNHMFEVYSGTSYTTGGYISLFGETYSTNPGGFELIASSTDTGQKRLTGLTNGSLTWNGNNVITSAGGTMTDNLVFNGVANTGLRCSNTSCLSMLSSNTWDSSCIHLWGCANDGNYPGCVEIIPRIGSDTYTVWRFTPDGELQKATNPIHYIVTTYKGSNNWYRIWDDGFIEQGGYLKGTANTQSTTVTLPKGFSNTTYHIVTNFEYTQQSGAYYGYLCAYSKTTTTFKTMLYKDNTGYTTWYACGY